MTQTPRPHYLAYRLVDRTYQQIGLKRFLQIRNASSLHRLTARGLLLGPGDKAAGVYKGRRPSIDPIAVAKLKGQGLGASKIAKQLGIGRASVYRVLTRRDPGPEDSDGGMVGGTSSVLQTSF